MRKSKADFLELIGSGEFYVVHKANDRNHDDLTLKREDGEPAEIVNYPYRINQLPVYIFNELISEGFLQRNGADEFGGAIFRATEKALGAARRAA